MAKAQVVDSPAQAWVEEVLLVLLACLHGEALLLLLASLPLPKTKRGICRPPEMLLQQLQVEKEAAMV